MFEVIRWVGGGALGALLFACFTLPFAPTKVNRTECPRGSLKSVTKEVREHVAVIRSRIDNE